MEFLLCSTNTHTPLFYGVSKIHNPNFSPHSITLRCDHHTGRLSLYITHFIQPLTNNLPSHIKDTKSFLNFIVNLPPLPSSTLLVTADVTFSCSNIPHGDCISVVMQFMEKIKHLISSNCAPSHIVRAILDCNPQLNTAPSVSLFQLCLFLEIYLHQHSSLFHF